jgi:hypothetical protein
MKGNGTAASAATAGTDYISPAGGTFTGEITTVASASGGAGFNLPPGSAPTSPANGDMWSTSAGLYVRIAGTTVGPLLAGTIPTAANPTATAGPTANNGSAATFMRSDGSPAVQKAGASQFGIVEPDNSTILCPSGVCSTTATDTVHTSSATTANIAGEDDYNAASLTATLATLASGQTLQVVTTANALTVALNSQTVIGLPLATTLHAYGFYGFTYNSAGSLTGYGFPGFGTITLNSLMKFDDATGAATASGLSDNGTTITASEPITTEASATGGAGLNLPPGTAPTSPNNGDIWVTSAGLYVRIAGTTVGPLAAGGTASAITPGTTTIGGATAPCLIENSTGTTMACPGVGSNVIPALGNALSSAGGVSSTIASGTSALGTGAISSGACASAVTTTATNTTTTDVIWWGFNGDPTSTTGYSPSANGMLTIIAYPSANDVNFKVCNNTSASVTPGAITLNWRVIR